MMQYINSRVNKRADLISRSLISYEFTGTLGGKKRIAKFSDQQLLKPLVYRRPVIAHAKKF